jgi:YgiT-type zinc finger domain-containing protein
MFKIEECVMCGCNDVPTTTLNVRVKSDTVKSVQVEGARCTNCGEEYYDLKVLKAIEDFEKTLNELAVGA